MGMYVQVLNAAGALVAQRWTNDDFFSDMMFDLAPTVGTNTYTVQITSDNQPAGSGWAAGPLNVMVEVVKR